MSEFSEKMGMAVGNNFKQGFNCCEAIVETFRKEAGVDIDDNALRLCSGFGGGIGHARHICGALVGCTMVISTLVGRNHPSEKPLSEIYPVSKEFHDRFEAEFDLVSGRYVIDAKSIMGIFSLDLLSPITVIAHTDYADDFFAKIEKFKS